LGKGKKFEFVLFIVPISFSIFATKVCRPQQTAGFENQPFLVSSAVIVVPTAAFVPFQRVRP